MSQLLSNFRGDSIYLDTMVFYAVLRASHRSAHILLKQIEIGVYHAYTSTLTFDSDFEQIPGIQRYVFES